MKKYLAAALVASSLGVTGISAEANPITTTIGNKNGFGVNVQDGAQFDFGFFGTDPGDGGTDWVIDETQWTNGAFEILLSGPGLTGTVTGATLEIFSGGWGAYGPASIELNGNFLHFLTDGENDGPPDPPDGTSTTITTAHRQVIPLVPAQLLLLTGNSNIIAIRQAASTPAGYFDSGVLDYVELTITTDAGGTTPVPEPTTWALTTLALAGLAASRRRPAR